MAAANSLISKIVLFVTEYALAVLTLSLRQIGRLEMTENEATVLFLNVSETRAARS